MERIVGGPAGRSGAFGAFITLVLGAELLFVLAVFLVIGRPPEPFTTIAFALAMAGALAYQERRRAGARRRAGDRSRQRDIS